MHSPIPLYRPIIVFHNVVDHQSFHSNLQDIHLKSIFIQSLNSVKNIECQGRFRPGRCQEEGGGVREAVCWAPINLANRP